MGAHVVITGASSGLGEHLALEMARRGYSVGLVARRQDLLLELAERVASEGGEAAVATADVTDAERLARAIASLEERLGPCAVLVANAGVGGPSPAQDLDLEVCRRTVEVNLMGAVNAAWAVLPGMLTRDAGQLVVISSVAAYRGLPGSGIYSATKAAVSTFWESLRVDLHGTGVGCTTIHPGFVRTPLTDKNDFPMPFRVEPDQAARWMADAIARRRRELTFPWPMAVLGWLMRRVPDAIWDALTSGRR